MQKLSLKLAGTVQRVLSDSVILQKQRLKNYVNKNQNRIANFSVRFSHVKSISALAHFSI